MDIKDVKDAMYNHNISTKTEALDAIEFVESLLMSEIKNNEENHSYATTTIRELHDAKRRVTDLYHEIDEKI